MADDRAYLYRTNSDRRWRWARKAANGEKVSASTEGYVNKADAEANYARVSGPGAPPLIDLTEPDPED